MVYLLNAEDMRGLISMGEAVEVTEAAFREWAADRQIGGLRRRVHAPSGARITLHQGASPQSGGTTGISVHCELVRIMPDGHQRYAMRGSPVRVLYDAETGELLAITIGEPRPSELPEVSALMGIPTAAAGTLGTKVLARADASDLGLLGAGTQARLHLAATCAIRPIKRVRVFSPTPSSREQFAGEMQDVLGIEVQAVERPQDAVTDAEIVLLMTNSNVPVLDGNWLAKGAHVTSVVWSNIGLVRRGQISQKRREIDDETFRRADIVATNSLDQVEFDQGGDLYDTVQRGVLDREKLADLGQILAGEAQGRTSPNQITVFKNCAFWGMADQAIASLIFKRAREQGRGSELSAAGVEVMDPRALEQPAPTPLGAR